MKTMKKILALVLAMMLVLGMTAALAEHSISLTSTDTHTYKVFQVLTGTLSAEGSLQLGNPAWGADATDEAKQTSVNDFISAITAPGISEQDIAQLVASKVNTNGNGQGTVTKDAPITGLATGYYVLVDVTQLDDDSLETKALNVVKVVNDVNNLAIKWGSTEDDKKIVADTLGANGNTYTPGVSIDNVSVGDVVTYEIKTKVPANANKYNYFYFVINDTLEAGLTFNNNIVVYRDSVSDSEPDNRLTLGSVTTGENGKVVTGDYLVKTEDIGTKTFEVALLDAKALAGHDIIVRYTATLNENAEIGEQHNDNTSTVTFSNNPNHDYDGENNPGFPASTDLTATGETPVTTTETYTTGIEIQKVDQDGNVLTGATFQISGESVKTVLKVSETFTAADDGDYYKLKDGKYTKTAPTTKDTMVPTPGATAGYVVDASYDGEDKKVVDGVTYRPYVPATDTELTVYVLQNNNSALYESTETKYKKTVTKTAENTTTEHKASMAVDSNGLARFDGLGAGTYTIKETVTPNGFNTLPDLTVTITFAANGDPHWTFSGGNGGYDGDEGIYKITIENNKGTQLPETGGIGTTIFYIGGSILVLAAAILLITKRRMSAND